MEILDARKGMADVEPSVAVGFALVQDVRPRTEVQPVEIGRQRPVRAVQHGKALHVRR